MQVWDNMFKNMEIQGRLLVDTGAIKTSDLESYIKASRSPKSKMVAVGIPAYCALKTLLVAAKAGSAGLLLSKFIHFHSYLDPIKTYVPSAVTDLTCEAVICTSSSLQVMGRKSQWTIGLKIVCPTGSLNLF